MWLGARGYSRSYHSQQSQLIVVSLHLAKALTMKQLLLILTIGLTLIGCEIREEYTFKKDGSGEYQMAFDMSELMNMDIESDSTDVQQPVDTLIVFSDMLDEKKDSIAQLDPEEQERLEKLRPLKMRMVMDDSTKQMNIKLTYGFESIDDLKNFSDAIEQADIKELDDLTAAGQPQQGVANDTVVQQEENNVFAMAESFETKFSSKKFSRKITEEARLDAVKKKDTTMTADDPFADMVRFKQVFRFPYRIKAVDNENAKILSDFMGVELEANMYQINNDPDFFNLEVLFE